MFDNNAVIQSMHRMNKLPSEDQLRSYMNQYIIADPYSSVMTSIDENTKKHTGLREATQMDSCWVGASFEDGYYPRPDPTWVRKEYDTEVDNLLPYSLHGLPAIFRNQYARAQNCFHSNTSYIVTRGSQLIDLHHTVSKWYIEYKKRQLSTFHKTLSEKGYVSVRTEPQTQDEICTRRTQYPGQDIYLVLGNALVKYFFNVMGNNMWHGARLITRGGGWGSETLSDYESAVIARPQIRTSHRFHFHYELNRTSRRWRTICAGIMQFTLEVEERQAKKEPIVELPPQHLQRFSDMI